MGGDALSKPFAGNSYCFSAGGGGGRFTGNSGDNWGGQGGYCASASASVGGMGTSQSKVHGTLQATKGRDITGSGGGGGGFSLGGSGSGANGGSGIVLIAYSLAAPTPILSATTPAGTGFTFTIMNHDALFTWTALASAGSVSVSGSVVTLTGLSALASSTVTVTSSRAGYANGTAAVTGRQEKVIPTVTWAPVTATTAVSSPLTPSVGATTNGGGVISYSLVSNTTSTCVVDASTGVLTLSGTGNCVVRAGAAASPTHLAGATDVTFTVSRAPQTVTWAPVTAISTITSPLTPSAPAVAPGGAGITYSKLSNTTLSCLVDAATGVLTYSGVGNCVVRATAALTSVYDTAFIDVTFTVSRATPTVTWTPETSLYIPIGSTTFAAASTSSPGVISYSVTNAGTTGCLLPSSARTLTFSAEGSCEVTASVGSTTDYNLVTSVKTFVIAKSPQVVTWAPAGSLTLVNLSANLVAATTSGDGAISYAVSSSGGTGCALATPADPNVTFNAAGSCSIIATAVSTSGFAVGTQSATIIISLATPTLSWSPTLALVMPAATVTPAAASTTSDGAISYAVTADTGPNCTVNSVTGTLSYTATGRCQVTASSASSTRFYSGSVAVYFVISLPVVGGGSDNGNSSGSTPAPVVTNSSSAELGFSSTPSGGVVESQDQIRVPGAFIPTRGRSLPPPPRGIEVTPSLGRSRSTVLIKQSQEATGSQVLATVVIVRNSKGAVVTRISIKFEPGQSQAQVTVPFVANGFSVNVYNVNEVGVSSGALNQSSLIRASTIMERTSSGQPTLFGTLIGKPIIFDGGSATLDATDRERLRAIARTAQASNQRIFVTGLARKGGGSEEELATLSARRAKATATYLVGQGLRVWIRYWGAGALLGSGTANDRRAEVRMSPQPIPRHLVP